MMRGHWRSSPGAASAWSSVAGSWARDGTVSMALIASQRASAVHDRGRVIGALRDVRITGAAARPTDSGKDLSVLLVPSDAERVGDAVDVVEPGGDERDLEDTAVVESRLPQAGVVRRRDARRVAGQLL